jgi:uncharacterized protein (TIGR02646 family)
MRPVQRGDAPRTYERYQDAIGDLEERLGSYCSYCERRLPVSLAVEHVTPKSVVPELETEWSNFLLGCTNCNSVKGDKETNAQGFFWPDRDNTLRAFQYRVGGVVETTAGLDEEGTGKANSLRDLVGLDRHPLAPRGRRPARRDKRWKDREQVWTMAERQKATLERLPEAVWPEVRSLILDTAAGYGFFSVWMTVFAGDRDIRLGLIARMFGTAADCFDADGLPVPRPGGRV